MLEDCFSIIIIQVLCSCSTHEFFSFQVHFFLSLIRIFFDFVIYQNLAVGQNINTEKKSYSLEMIIDSLLNTNILIKTCRFFRTLHHKES